jgi:AcrR family transcriptional regulator
MSRDNQKRRTRRAIVTAAADLLSAGRQPTVAEVADAAEVSKATAYSYFPKQQVLLEEAGLELAEKARVEDALNAAWAGCGEDVLRRWEVFCPIYYDLYRRNEAVYRSMLRTQQERWLEANARGQADSVVVRQARRVPIIDELLAPLRPKVAAPDYRRLADSLAVVAGIEPLVVLKDICGLPFDQAVERMTWAGRVMIQATLTAG